MSEDWVPHGYQKKAIKFILERANSGLFLDPGLGKTSVTLAALSILIEKKLIGAALIVAPLRVIYTVWPEEIKKWAAFNHLRVSIIHGDNKKDALKEDADIYLVNPEGILWLFDDPKRVAELTKKVDVLVIDESTKFRDTSTRRFKILKPHLNKFKRRIILTGTPAPNNLEDLFGQIYLLDLGGSLGKFVSHFRSTYFMPAGYGGYDWKIIPGGADTIYEKVSPFVMRMAAEDYIDMPELINDMITVQLPPAAMKLYKETENTFLTSLGEGKVVISPSAAAAGGRCRQIANGGLYTGEDEWMEIHTAKISALEDLIESLQGSPLLVFYEYRHDAERIQKHLGGNIPNLSGGDSELIIMAFNSGALPVVIAHPASAGHGLNLQMACNHVCFFGITWDLELYDQGLRRVYRQGNKMDHVIIHHIVAQDTLDSKVLRTLYDKSRTQQALFNALKDYHG